MATRITPEDWLSSSGDPNDLGFSVSAPEQPRSALPYLASGYHQWIHDFIPLDICLAGPGPDPTPPAPIFDDSGPSHLDRAKAVSGKFPCKDMNSGCPPDHQAALDLLPPDWP